jgi:hypothetical protein
MAQKHVDPVDPDPQKRHGSPKLDEMINEVQKSPTEATVHTSEIRLKRLAGTGVGDPDPDPPIIKQNSKKKP